MITPSRSATSQGKRPRIARIRSAIAAASGAISSSEETVTIPVSA